jgi:cytochrome c oxidase assembly protein subunit 15
MLTIGLVAVLWRADNRRWMRGVGFAALALVLFQGILGGMRVLLDERTLAMVHGCTGPLFFALSVAIVVFTSRRWACAGDNGTGPIGANTANGHIRRLAIVTSVLAYLQIVLGAVVRHVPIDAQPGSFALAVRFHLFLAAVLTLHIAILVWFVLRHARGARPLGWLAAALGSLVVLQLALGAATWIAKFAVPAWAAGWVPAPPHAMQHGHWVQTHIITAHVAAGSLILVTSLALALFAHRLLPVNTAGGKLSVGRLGAAV